MVLRDEDLPPHLRRPRAEPRALVIEAPPPELPFEPGGTVPIPELEIPAVPYLRSPNS